MRLRLFLFFVAIIFTASAFAQLKGNATYYHNKFHGRLTSDGSVYHKDSMTCAHRTLPFGTILRVVNKKNGKEVIVKVNDRGPFRPGAIIDLSLAAAKEIDMLRAGIVPVLAYELSPEELQELEEEPDVIVLPELKIVESMKSMLMLPVDWAALRFEKPQHRDYRILQEEEMAVRGKRQSSKLEGKR